MLPPVQYPDPTAAGILTSTSTRGGPCMNYKTILVHC